MTDKYDAKARELCKLAILGLVPEIARYGPEFHSALDEIRADISSALRDAVAEAETKWMLAQKALNQIDDGFEYRYGDEKSRAFVHKVFADYTASIRSRGNSNEGR